MYVNSTIFYRGIILKLTFLFCYYFRFQKGESSFDAPQRGEKKYPERIRKKKEEELQEKKNSERYFNYEVNSWIKISVLKINAITV